ncbi:DUF6069 family protein [Streptomyces sp. NPDC096339]|uniref:DUF6069 family protein n=1 Tax=Streptomyces sp. NPDC096339 TaxID=3366086 RepID=UPI00382B0140
MASIKPAATRTAQGRSRLPAWQAVVGAAVIAAVLNVVVLLVGNAAGAALVLELNGKPDEIGPAYVIIMSVLAPAVGLTASVLLKRWQPGFLRVAQVLAAAVAMGQPHRSADPGNRRRHREHDRCDAPAHRRHHDSRAGGDPPLARASRDSWRDGPFRDRRPPAPS